ALRESPEHLARRAESDPVRQSLSDPAGRLAAQFYSLLTGPQQQQLFDSKSFAVSFAALMPAQQAPLRALFAQTVADLRRMNEEFVRRQREEGSEHPLTLLVPK